MLRLLFNIMLIALVAAGAAVTIIVFQDAVGNFGIMQLSYQIAWMVFFAGLAGYFVLRIFLGERISSSILMLVGLVTTVFAVMFMVDMIQNMPSFVTGFVNTMQYLYIAITITVLGMLTLVVGASKSAKNQSK